MVRPGLVNLDFADVETIMKGMGKAMMGTGEAEGEKRAEEATNAALNNPLIDEYSLKGAKGLLVNITGGNDLTMFEVDEAVNKIRAEVDTDAELIFGSIEDENLNGKIRVSIVATSLDGQAPHIKPVVSMVHRLQNRNTGYLDSSMNKGLNNQSILQATEGATALDLNVDIQKNEDTHQLGRQDEISESSNDPELENISMENATYFQNMENKQEDENFNQSQEDTPTFEVDSIELATPELFSSDDKINFSSNNINESDNEPQIFENQNIEGQTEIIKEPEMFDEPNLEDDFEIPAFLRKQKN
jgi:cell division protein FtsZ